MNACQILADKARPIYPQFALSDRLQVRSTPLSLTTHPAVVRSNTGDLCDTAATAIAGPARRYRP